MRLSWSCADSSLRCLNRCQGLVLQYALGEHVTVCLCLNLLQEFYGGQRPLVNTSRAYFCACLCANAYGHPNPQAFL